MCPGMSATQRDLLTIRLALSSLAVTSRLLFAPITACTRAPHGVWADGPRLKWRTVWNVRNRGLCPCGVTQNYHRRRGGSTGALWIGVSGSPTPRSYRTTIRASVDMEVWGDETGQKELDALMVLSMLVSPPVAFPCTAHQHSPVPQPHTEMDALPHTDRATYTDSRMGWDSGGVFGKDSHRPQPGQYLHAPVRHRRLQRCGRGRNRP